MAACGQAAAGLQAQEALTLPPSHPAPLLFFLSLLSFPREAWNHKHVWGRTMPAAQGGRPGSSFIKKKAIEMTHLNILLLET